MERVVVHTSLMKRVRRTPPWLLDALLASLVALTGLATVDGSSSIYQPRDGVAVILIFAAAVPYLLRRRAPLVVFCLSVVSIAALFALDYDGGAMPMVVAVGAYLLGASRPAREVLVGAAVTLIALVAIIVTGSPEFGSGELVTSTAGFGATMLLGWTMQSRRLRLEALEREQGEASRRAAADERLRIAQELHDVVAHSLGVIAVQSGVGMHVIESDPGEALRALEHISRTSRASLVEIRRLLGLVRAGDPMADHTPAAGIAELARLAHDVTEAGLRVELEVTDRTTDLPPGVDLAVYRIVQEALTNALRHAHARHACVRVDAHGGSLRVTVTDDGTGNQSDGRLGGHGLVGMRERVAVYGGTLDVGPRSEGGFSVEATLPYNEVSGP